MDFLIQNAWAEGPAQQAQEIDFMSFIPLILIFVVFYFILLRPQMKRAKEHKNMVAAMAKNDEVVTNGGVLGRITVVGDSFLTVEIANGVEIHLQKNAVASIVPKGTIKSTAKASSKAAPKAIAKD